MESCRRERNVELMRCPHCRQPLVRADHPPLRVWTCSACGGCAATLAVLRRAIRHDVLQQVWNRTTGHARTSLLRCPSCSNAMNCVPTEGPEVDLCRACQLVWFDAGELDELPHRSAESIAAEEKANRRMRERREWRRRREADEAFVTWLQRHPVYVPFR